MTACSTRSCRCWPSPRIAPGDVDAVRTKRLVARRVDVRRGRLAAGGGTATACPRISRPSSKSSGDGCPARWFNQEYLCMFEEADGAVFAHDDIEAAFMSELEALPW